MRINKYFVTCGYFGLSVTLRRDGKIREPQHFNINEMRSGEPWERCPGVGRSPRDDGEVFDG